MTLAGIRDMLIERMWVCLCIYGLVGIPLVVLRAARFGGGPGRSLPVIAIALFGIVAFLMRRRMPPLLRAALPSSVMMLAGLAGLAAAGLQGSGIIALIFGSFCVTTTCPPRVAVPIVALAWVAASLIALAYVTGLLLPPFGLDFTSNPVVWAGTILSTLLVLVYLASAVAAYQVSMGSMLHELEDQRDQIAALANHDTLTGLPSLRLARDRVDMACSQAQRGDTHAALLFVDLDGFKDVNDNHGHEAGDAVLRAVAQRLLSMVRATDTAARIGGDEFLVVLTALPDEAAANATANKIAEALRQPIDYEGRAIQVGASVGVALFPDHGQSSDALLRHADRAMYGVKKAGKRARAPLQTA